jgi:hypothetical protein
VRFAVAHGRLEPEVFCRETEAERDRLDLGARLDFRLDVDRAVGRDAGVVDEDLRVGAADDDRGIEAEQ